MDRNSYEDCAKYVEENLKVEAVNWPASSTTAMAEAGTGSWYGVVITNIANIQGRFGGTTLIAVTCPWSSAYIFNPHPGEKIHASYIAEKLIPRENPAPIDVAALTAAVNEALNYHFGVKK